MKKNFIFLFIIFAVLVFLQAQDRKTEAVGPECTLAINELLPDPKGTDTGNEWIELFNCSDIQINLENYTLKDKSGGSYKLDGQVIEGKSFVVVYPSFSLNQSNEEIFLYSQEGNLIDYFSYESSKEDISWAREKDGTGTWTDQLPPTPGETNEITYPSDIRINEIYPSPNKENDEQEWIEIYNFSEEAVSLDEWLIKDLSSQQLLNGIEITAQGFFVINEKDLSITLNNSGDTITLTDPAGKSVSVFTYKTTATGISNIYYQGNIVQTRKATPLQENTYIDPSDPFYELNEISIEQFKELKPESLYILTGVITAAPDQIYSGKAYIQDDSGGILVELPDNTAHLNVGEKVQICAVYKTYYQEPAAKISNDKCIRTAGNGNLRINKIEDLADFEANLGDLVELQGNFIKKNSDTIFLDFLGSEIKVKINSNLKLQAQAAEGDLLKVTAILTTYGSIEEDLSNYRLRPRESADIQIIKSIKGENVKGENAERENTDWLKRAKDNRISLISSLTKPSAIFTDLPAAELAIQKIFPKSSSYKLIGAAGIFNSVSGLAFVTKKFILR